MVDVLFVVNDEKDFREMEEEMEENLRLRLRSLFSGGKRA